jgi:F-type H+-transporting ATPase subunit delta
VKSVAISRRYAKALLLIGKEDGQADTYRAELQGVSELFSKEHALEQAVSNPLYETASRKKVLRAVLEKLNLSPVMNSFLLLLFDKGRISFLSSVNDFYQKLVDELKGVARALVVSATTLSQDTLDKIQGVLSKKTGKDILFDVKEDPSLIGGVVTQIGDLVFDGSIKTQLLNMRESLKKGEGV